MHNDVLLKQCRDVEAAIAELLDAGVEVQSVMIGPTHMLPTIRVAAGEYTARHSRDAHRCIYTGEMRRAMGSWELAWAGKQQTADDIAEAFDRALRELDNDATHARGVC